MGFDPITMGVMAIATTIGGGVVAAAGARQSADSQAANYRYQMEQARINKQIAKNNADYQRVTGDLQAQKFGLASRQRMGRIRAAMGASGFKIDDTGGSQVQDSQRIVDVSDQATIRANAARRAYAYEVEGTTEGNKASAYAAAAENTETAGDLSVMSSLLGTASSVSSKWMQGRQSGIW